MAVERVGDHRRERFLGADARDRILAVEIVPDPLRRALDHAKNGVCQFPRHGAPKRLASAAMAAGVQTRKDFGKFQNRGYQGLYGGRGVDEIRDYKSLPVKANILDHMGSTELVANLFRITQTEEKLRSRNIRGKEAACNAHYEVGVKVRETMRDLSGIMPEDLPVADDVKRIVREERKLHRMRSIPAQQRIEQPLAGPKASDPVEIDLRADLWKYALLIS